MDKKTLKALKGSIKKWEKIVAGTGTDHGQSNCPLCKKFYDYEKDTCHGCPVYQNSGAMGCAGTPYDDFSDWDMENWGEPMDEEGIRLAMAELDYLKSLLPKKIK